MRYSASLYTAAWINISLRTKPLARRTLRVGHQNLLHHPHVHCVIPSGGLSTDHKAWVRPRYRFFLPVKVLSRIFRGKFVAGLKRAYLNNELCLPGTLKPLAQDKAFRSFLRSLFRQDWVGRFLRPRIPLHPNRYGLFPKQYSVLMVRR